VLTRRLALTVVSMIALAAAPRSAAAQTVQVIDVEGFPSLHLVVDSRDADLEAMVAASNAAMHDSLAPGARRADRVAWQERRAAAIQSLAERARTLATPHARRVAAVLVSFVTEDTVARSPDTIERHGAAMRTSMARCGAVTEPELQPWAERCRALAAWWTAMASWRAGPQWPTACEPQRSAPSAPILPSGQATIAVLLSSSGTSLRPAAETRRLRAAIIEAARGWVPSARVLSVDELEAAERAHVEERRLDGSACLSGDFSSALEAAHPRLWLARVSATCPLHGQSGTCALSVSFWSSTEDPELPPDREIDLGVPSATVDELAAAASRLAAVAPRVPIRSGRFGVLTWTPPTGQLFGFSTSIDAMAVVGLVTPARAALQQCRDLDASPPGAFDVALEIARTGRVAGVTLSSQTRGSRRRACLERVFRGLRFATSRERTRTAVVTGGFGLAADPQVSLRVSSPPSARITADARTADALIACHPAGSVDVVNLDVDVASNGSLQVSAAAPTSPLADCVARALSAAVSTCGSPQHVRAVVCVGQPIEVPRPVRP
jgi:hypothetical protein